MKNHSYWTKDINRRGEFKMQRRNKASVDGSIGDQPIGTKGASAPPDK